MATTWTISIQGEGTPVDDILPRASRFITSLGTAGIPVTHATISSSTIVTLAGETVPSPGAVVPLLPANSETTTVDLTPKKGKK